MQIILASQSKTRKRLLSLLKIPFQAIPAQIDEEKIVASTPLETIMLRAKKKGEEVYYRIKNKELRIKNKSSQLSTFNFQLSTYLIISADSMALLDNQSIGKPTSKKEAEKMLQLLSGKTHYFITAIYCILIEQNVDFRYKKARVWHEYEKTSVTFRKLTKEAINLYLSLTNPTIYAAGYALSDTPQNFITKVEGSISNVMGLPLEKIIPILRENKIDLLYNNSQ